MSLARCSIENFKEILKDNKEKIIIDIRSATELKKLPMIENSVHIPLENLKYEIDDFPNDIPIYIFCARGIRAENAANLLNSVGKNAIIVNGGVIAYYNSLM